MSDATNMPCALAIGGLDPSGGAGLPADVRAMSTFGTHCCTVATAVIAQNTCGVAAIEAVSSSILGMQLDNLLADIKPRAIKIGMLPHPQAVTIITDRLQHLPNVPVIVDTVFAPSSGPGFSNLETVQAVAQKLLPLAEIVTPNIPEAEQLSGQEITDFDSLKNAAIWIYQNCGARYVLIKGGHWPQVSGDNPDNETPTPDEALDVLYDGSNFSEFRAPRVIGYEVRGTGCLLASAIAAQRARNVPVSEAIAMAKTWLTEKIRGAQAVGQGRRIAL